MFSQAFFVRVATILHASFRCSGVTFCLAWGGIAVSVSAAEKPNVVFLLADDLGYGDVACFGGERCRIETPGFDRIARQGMRFTDAHVNASVCVPTRMAIMTGRYAWRFEAPERGGPWGFLGLRFPPSQHTLATMMKQAGYHTAYVGKWHLGTRMETLDGATQGPTNVDYKQPLRIGPPQYGWHSSFILPGSLDMYPYAFVKDNAWVGQVTAQKGWSAFNRLGPAAADFEDFKVLDRFTQEAESYIAERAKASGDEPFFLYLALTAPHTPVSPSAGFQGKSTIGIYGDFVMETDDCVRRVLDALDKNGFGPNTLVIATSDHGAAAYAGPQAKATYLQNEKMQAMGHYSCGPFRGYKFSVYEGGLRVPFVARWPGVVKPGASCDRLIAVHDLMATLAEAAGIVLAESQAPDSISFLPLLKDAAAEPPRKSMILQGTRGRAVRLGKWKLAVCPGSGCDGRFGNKPRTEDAWRRAIADFGRQPRNHSELRQAPFVQLFDLAEDPGESRNLAAQHPEKVAQMFAVLEDSIARGRSTPGRQLENGRPGIRPFLAVPGFVLAK